MAAIDSLRDDFAAGYLNTARWTDVAGGVTVQDGAARLPLSTAGARLGVAETVDLTSGAIVVNLTVPDTTSTTRVIRMRLTLDASNYLEFEIAGGRIAAKRLQGTNTTNVSATYRATDNAWLRIRERDGVVYWETSADGRTWTTRTSRAPGFAVTALRFAITAVHTAESEAASTVTVDNVNVLPGQAGPNDPPLVPEVPEEPEGPGEPEAPPVTTTPREPPTVPPRPDQPAPPPPRWTPFERLDYELYVFWIRTGEVIDVLDRETAWDYSDSLSWGDLGAMSVTVPLLGRRSILSETNRATLRAIRRELGSLGVALVRLNDRRCLWAGPVMGAPWSHAEISLRCASIAKIMDSRILIANDYWGWPNDERGKLHFELGTRDLVLELLKQGSTGYRRDLPLVIPEQSGTTGAAVEYAPQDLHTVYEAVKQVTERDDGPDVWIRPELYEKANGSLWIRWVCEVGDPLLGTVDTYKAGDPLPTWDWSVNLGLLEGDPDATEMVSTAYIVGDNLGTSSTARLIAVDVRDRGDPLPALERADRTTVSSTDMALLQAQARSYGQVHQYPVEPWAMTVSAQHWPLLGIGWQLGDLVRIRVDGHGWLDDGDYLRRIIAIKQNTQEITLTTTDGSEAGLARWTG